MRNVTDFAMINELDQQVLHDLYAWVDSIPLSRPKRNISRDFSDGVLVAEVIRHFFPKYVDIHNFQSCNKTEGKRNNWHLLNRKVFSKFSFKLTDDVVDSLVNAQPGTIEKLLLLLRSKFREHNDVPGDNDNRFSPMHPSQIVLPRVVTPTSNLQRLRRVPSVCTENSASEKTLPVITKKSTQSLSPFNKAFSVSKSLNRRSWRQPNINNGPRDIAAQDMLQVYEQKVQECLELQETVDILNAKLRHTQHLLQLKDMRITELQSRLEYFSMT
ncbi:sperm flagellar protein 1 [Echinococcus multilocularis]|uniref:Sperm flagellar protein 1 n=1 Tax=Echinococcus multilocularis TaxID=6211 RepID=A0A068Y474_ECHMU|nr:sperm flagellar protein 1 [Echinococcus multilocularis]